MGGGNHLEIGTLFGGSAIAVAMAKNRHNQSGVVVCVDPLNGYYKSNTVDPVTKIPVSVDVLFKNIDTFGVHDQIMVLKSKSEAINNLVDMRFTTAYIDGDHENGTPLEDWNRVKDMVTRYVIFDNHDKSYPEVMRACELADKDADWNCVYKQEISYVVERMSND